MPQDARNLRANRGSSNFDVKHRFVLSGVWQFPFGKSPGVASALVRNWQLSGIWSRQTGQPFTPTLNTDPTATGATARPDRLRNGDLPAGERSIDRWFDITAFVRPACPCFGNSGRGILRGPGFQNVDVSLVREFRHPGALPLPVPRRSLQSVQSPELQHPGHRNRVGGRGNDLDGGEQRAPVAGGGEVFF